MEIRPSRLRKRSSPKLKPKVAPPEMSDAERSTIDLRVPIGKAWRFSEHVLQVSLVRELHLLRSQYPEIRWLHAIPNGGHRGKAAAGKMKAEGQRTGVCDLSMPVPRIVGARIYHGFYLELKKQGESPSAEQWEWLIYLHRAGYAAHVANDRETARKLVTDYLSLSPPAPFTGPAWDQDLA